LPRPAIQSLADATVSGKNRRILIIRRSDGIVTSMLAHSCSVSGERQSVDINALIEDALNLADHGARPGHLAVRRAVSH
jgi:hypothetical protein